MAMAKANFLNLTMAIMLCSTNEALLCPSQPDEFESAKILTKLPYFTVQRQPLGVELYIDNIRHFLNISTRDTLAARVLWDTRRLARLDTYPRYLPSSYLKWLYLGQTKLTNRVIV